MTFKELAKLGQEQLANQKPVTLEQARAQAQRVKERIVDRSDIPSFRFGI